MKVELKVSLESDQFLAVGKFAREEEISEKQAIRWLIDEGLKSFNGAGAKAKLQATSISGKGEEE